MERDNTSGRDVLSQNLKPLAFLLSGVFDMR